MKKVLFFITICSLSCPLFSQSTYFEIVKPRIDVVNIEHNSRISNKFIVLSGDTLYAHKKPEPNLEFINSSKNRRRIAYIYESQVFKLTTEKSKKIYYLKQWSVPIIIYMDKNIPKNVKNDFILFCSQFENIRNLNISFTKDIKKANYYIKSTEESINLHDDDDFESDEELHNSTHYAGTYTLITDSAKKLNGGLLKLNLNDMSSEIKLLRQMKQLFFMSLGNFYLRSNYPESSILSKKYNNCNELSINDIDLLKMHYSIIYDQKINGTTFNNLQKFQMNKQ